MEASRHYRRWAFESAALDLALRQAGIPFHEAIGREPQPLEFVCSTRLTTFDGEAGSSTEAISKRLAKYPGLAFKLDPENDWTPELIAAIGELATGPRPRPQGSLPRYPGRRRDRPGALPPGSRGLPRGLPRGPRRQRRDPGAARAARRPGHLGRAAAFARRHHGARMAAEGDQLEAVAVRVAAGAVRGLRALRRERDRDLRRRAGRGRGRPRPDPVPRLALPRRHSQRHRALRLQRPGGPVGPADRADGSDAGADRLSLGLETVSDRSLGV